jgi:hypothetical protein
VKCDDPEEEVAKFLEGDNKEEELEEGEEGEIYFCTLSVILKVSMFLVCSVIRNLLLGIVPKQSVILFLEGAADSSDASTASAAVLVQSCNDPKVEEVVVFMEEQSTKPQILSFVPCIVVCSY